VASLARAPDEDLTMEQRTSSPYPGKDRPVLAVIGILLVISTVVFAVPDQPPETLAEHGMPALAASFYKLDRSQDVFTWDPV
jgi:hypothetical protein